MDHVAAATHPVDQDALRIWFALWPEILPALAPKADFFQLKGAYLLDAVADSSHDFLYGHRYWPAVKQALAQVPTTPRWERIEAAAKASGAPLDFALAMAAIAQMTFEQCGSDFLARSCQPQVSNESPAQFLKRRQNTGRKGLFGLFGSKANRITFQEQREDAWFSILPTQEITTAAELDKRPYHQADARCYEGMGPIPVDCRSGSCGTCWVGVLAGNDNLDPVEDFERKRMQYFGYWDSGFIDSAVERPLLRLACQTRANGSATIVIPPWNGVFGRSRRERESLY